MCVCCSGGKCALWFCSCSEWDLLQRPLMTAGLPISPAPAACRISTASLILLHPSLITVFRVVPTLVSDSQKTRVSSLAGMEVEPSTLYSSRVTLPSTDPTHWRLTSQPCCAPTTTPLELVWLTFPVIIWSSIVYIRCVIQNEHQILSQWNIAPTKPWNDICEYN